VPVDQSVALLNTLKTQGKDFTVVIFPDAGHGLLDSPPTDPQAPTIFVEWVERVHTEAKRSWLWSVNAQSLLGRAATSPRLVS
jgi:hypothetical protein